jgi:histidine triad (HIT) family protein
MPSLFTRIVQGEIPAHVILEDENYFAFLDVFPLVEGHVLVIPKKEVDYLFELDDETLAGLFIFAKRVATAVGKAIPCRKVGVSVIGLEVPHAHVHLVPLQQVDDMNFSKPKLKPSTEELVAVAARIKAAF